MIRTIAAEWDFNLAAAAEYVKKSGLTKPSFELRVGSNDPDARKIAQIIQGDLAKIGVTANLALKDPTTLVNDAIAGNFESNVYACSIGVPEVQDFEDCSVYRPNKGPFSGAKTFPEFKQAYYDRRRRRRSAATHRRFQASVRGVAPDRLGGADMHAWTSMRAEQTDIRCGVRREDSPRLSGDREVIAGGP